MFSCLQKKSISEINLRNLLLILFFTFFSVNVFSAPATVTFQARIVKPDLTNLESSSVSFKFYYLYPKPGGTDLQCVIYAEEITGVNMTGSKGLVTLQLGSGTRTYGSGNLKNVFDNSTASYACQAGGTYTPGANDNRRVIVQFNDGTGTQTLPPSELSAVPYSLQSYNSQRLGNNLATDFLKFTDFTGTCAAGEYLKYDSTASPKFSCATPAGSGSGIVMSIAPGTGPLLVGGTAADPTISIPKATVSTDGYLSSADFTTFNSKLSNFSALTSSDISVKYGYVPASQSDSRFTDTRTPTDGSVTAAKIASATITFDKLNQSSATTGQVIKWNGSAWVASSDDTGAGGTVTSVSASGPLSSSGGGSPNITIAKATASVDGYLSSADFTTFAAKLSNFSTLLSSDITSKLGYTPVNPSTLGTAALLNTNQVVLVSNLPANCSAGQTLTFSSPTGSWVCSNIILGSSTVTSAMVTSLDWTKVVNTPTTAAGYGIPQATTTVNGYLSSADWTTFNSKQSALGFTALNSANNLSDLVSSTTARTNLGLGTTQSPTFTGLTLSGITGDTLLRANASGVLANATSADITGLLGFTPANTASSWTLNASGDISRVSGNVGIGTATPGKLLDVSGSDSIDNQIWIRNTNSTTSKYPGFIAQNFIGSAPGGFPALNVINSRGSLAAPAAIQSGDTLGAVVASGNYNSTPSYTNSAIIRFLASGNYSGTSTPSAMTFSTTPTSSLVANEALRIDSNGNVGIGTTNPQAKLNITDGSQYFDLTGLAHGVTTIVPTTTFGRIINNNVNGGMHIQGFSSGSNSGISIGATTGGSNTVSPIILFANKSNGTGVQDLADSDLLFQIRSNASTKMTMRGNGNVGIGTESPDAKLQVHDSGTFISSGSGANSTLRNSNSTNGDYLSFGWIGQGVWGLMAADSTTYKVLSLQPFGGNVGIGTSTPGSKLHVVGDTTSAPFIIQRSSGTDPTYGAHVMVRKSRGSIGVETAVQSGDELGTLWFNGYDGTTFQSSSRIIGLVDGASGSADMPGRMEFQTTPDGSNVSVTRLTIKNDGKVGVGTSSPSGKLDVSTDGLMTSASSDNSLRIGTSVSAQELKLSNYDAASSLIQATYNDGQSQTNLLLNPFGGNVGVGTATPVAKLDVAGEVKFGNTSSTCNSTNEGQQRYNSTSKNMEFCNGTSWTAYGTGAGTSVPSGAVMSFAQNTCPSGWINANGAAVSRTTYANLFAAVGTTYGVGNGSTTFNVPELRGEFIRGWDNGRGIDSGRAIATAQAAEVGPHDHYLTGGAAVISDWFGGSGNDYGVGVGSVDTSHKTATSGSSGLGSETRPRNVALLYCIKE